MLATIIRNSVLLVKFIGLLGLTLKAALWQHVTIQIGCIALTVSSIR